MEIRCGKCNKLFRVSDDKITGSGIKFPCSKCGESVKITQEDFEHYKLSRETAAALASFEPKPKVKPASVSPEPSAQAAGPAPAASALDFDLSEPPQAEPTLEAEAPPVFVPPAPPKEPAPEPNKPMPVGEPKAAPKTEPKTEPKPTAPAAHPSASPKPAATLKPEPPSNHPQTSPSASASSAGEEKQTAAPVSPAPSALSAPSSGTSKKLMIFIAVLVVAIAAAVFGVKWYLGQAAQKVSDAVMAVTTPEGLQIMNAAGAIDPVTQDLVITGVIENTTDKQRPAWYIVADVYDAQSAVIFRAKMLSGKQLYTRRDYDILIKRGQNIEDIKKKMQEQGAILPPKGTVNFEIRIMEPPAGIASFNVTLQPFDPVQLFKELAEEQKQH